MYMSQKDLAAKIVRTVLAAQVASNIGKMSSEGLDLLTGRLKHQARNGYAAKPKLEIEAIRLINIYTGIQRKAGNETGLSINYFLMDTPDQNGYDSILVYFDFKYKSHRYQVSFHNPWSIDIARMMSSKINSGRCTHWDRGCSMESIAELALLVENW